MMRLAKRGNGNNRGAWRCLQFILDAVATRFFVGDCLNVHKEEEEKSAPNFGGQTNNGAGCGGNARWREGRKGYA